MTDRRPVLIARCADIADVIAAVDLARDSGLPLAVRGTGQTCRATASATAGLVLDLARMNTVEVEADRRAVRADGGVTIGSWIAHPSRSGPRCPWAW